MHIIAKHVRWIAALAVLASSPAAAIRVEVAAFTALGVSEPKARCIVRELGEGADLAEAGEEDSEGELQSVLDQYRQQIGKAALVANRQFFTTVAARAFTRPANRERFLEIALNTC